MSSLANLRFLRPYLHADLPAARCAAYARFYASKSSPEDPPSSTQQRASDAKRPLSKTGDSQFRGDVRGRMQELQKADALHWPRVKSIENAVTTGEYALKYKRMEPGEMRSSELVTLRGTRCRNRNTMLSSAFACRPRPCDDVRPGLMCWVCTGRVTGFRVASNALVFVDISQEGVRMQVVLNRSSMAGRVDDGEFKKFYHVLRRGDVIGTAQVSLPSTMIWTRLTFYHSGVWQPVRDETRRAVSPRSRLAADPRALSRLPPKDAGGSRDSRP